jgi:hypothetical protein
MAVAHDAYPFDAAGFATEARALLDADDPAGLRDAALAAYHDSADVRTLADRYGGWDHDALATELDDDPPFWLALVLYRHLDASHAYGLGVEWHDLAREHATLGLSEHDAERLVRGRPLSELDPRLADVQPASTAAHAGWLAAEDAQRYARALTSTTDDGGASALRTPLREMLDHAPLCVIVSG